jgi:hypothetical protein
MMDYKGNRNTVVCAKTNNVATNERYNQQLLSIKIRMLQQKRCYKERGGILFIMESSIIVFTWGNIIYAFHVR